MRILMLSFLCLFATTASAQDVADRDETVAATAVIREKEKTPGGLLQAAELKARVRDMRRAVLGGGPSVEKAEREALGFYRRKVQKTAMKIDELRTERDVKDAEYRLALDASLSAEDTRSEDAAVRRAGRLKKQIGELDAEIRDLNRQRTQLGNAVVGIRNRMDRRRRVVARLDEEQTIESLPFLGETALGPDDEDMDAEDPLVHDDEFFADLLERDPQRARQMLLLRDPERYWRLFPLAPPAKVLRDAFKYPSQWGK